MAEPDTTTKKKGGKTAAQLERIKNGNCWQCGNPRGEDGTREMCRPHAKRMSELGRNYRARLRAAGRCTQCRGPLTPHHRKSTKLCKNCVSPKPIKGRYFFQYGITVQDFERMVILQKGVCAICKKKELREKGTLSVDHCHATKKIRGLLCRRCNRALGFFHDDPAELRAAATYLENAAKRLF